MKKILIINGHPYDKSFCAAIFHTYADNIDREKAEVRLLDLGKMDFDPVLRFGYSKFMEPDAEIEYSQESLKWADHVVVVFPIWWSTMPSLLKGWFDRVLTPGFAYNMRGFRTIKHLRGKTLHIVTTSQAPAFYLFLAGNSAVRLVKHQILGRCGLRTIRVDRLGFMTTKRDTPERRERFLARIARAARAITR